MNPDKQQELFNTSNASYEVNPYPLCITTFVLTLLSVAYWFYHLPSLTGQYVLLGLFSGLCVFGLVAVFAFLLFKRHADALNIWPDRYLPFLCFMPHSRAISCG